MATILVPALSASAFNKHRPVSDLLKGQLKHFHHIESSLPAALRSNMTPRELATENGAARYIAHLTNALKTMNQAKGAKPIPIRRSASRTGLAIAASDAVADDSTDAGPKPKTAKPAAIKRATVKAKAERSPAEKPSAAKRADAKPATRSRKRKS